MVAFDPKNPRELTDDFLVVVLDKGQAKLLGVRSKMTTTCGLLVYVGQELTVNDLFKELVDAGCKIESVKQALSVLEQYIAKLQKFRIGNLLAIESDPVNGFKLVKLADAPPSTSSSKLP